jgi:hypothetical protein
MFDPDAGMPRINRGMVYLGACLIAGIRLARERQVNVRVVPTDKAIEESVARNRLSSREAGQLYAAWRGATAAVRERLLDEPQVFLKTHRQHAADPPSPAIAELGRELDVVMALARRANRRLSGATVELDQPQCTEAHHKIQRAIDELDRLAAKIPQEQGAENVESRSTSRDTGTEHAKGEQARDCAGAEGQPADGARSAALEFGGGADVIAGGVRCVRLRCFDVFH